MGWGLSDMGSLRDGWPSPERTRSAHRWRGRGPRRVYGIRQQDRVVQGTAADVFNRAAVNVVVAAMDRCTACGAAGTDLAPAVLAVRQPDVQAVMPLVLCRRCVADPARTEARLEALLAAGAFTTAGRWCWPAGRGDI